MKRTVLAISCLMVGCGYHVAGTRSALPPEVRSVSVGQIENRSGEQGLEKLLAFALEREIAARGTLRWEPQPEGGDAIFRGTIRSLAVRPVAFNSRDEAVQYEFVLSLDCRLERAADGEVLWQVKGLRVQGEYATSPGVVVVSSAGFQQQPLDAANLRDPEWSPRVAADPNAVHPQLAESFRYELLRSLVREAAREVYAHLLEDF